MMAVTTKGRYATRIMVYLAAHDGAKPSTKDSIGLNEGISPGYVEQIMIRLKAAKLVRSHRGRNGGFSLARMADSISMGDVLRAVEGPVSPVPCLHERCDRAGACPTRPVWQKVAEVVESILDGTTIGQMARQAAVCGPNELSYDI